MVLSLVVGLCEATAGAEAREPKPLVLDLKDIKDKLIVARDAAGGTYVVLRGEGLETRAWYGTGKALYEQVVIGGSSNGDTWELSIWAPRVPQLRPGTIAKRPDGSYFKSCDELDDAVLTLVTGDKAKAVVDKSSFMSSAMVRRPHLLARDESGVYYYVDKLSRTHGGNGFRVFVGRKGALKQLALTDIATDSAGQVFSTKTGDLRLVKTQQDAKSVTAWVKGAKRTELIPLDLDVNSRVIFKELGVYKFTGTICDNI
jgi:hypothetical protein